MTLKPHGFSSIRRRPVSTIENVKFSRITVARTFNSASLYTLTRLQFKGIYGIGQSAGRGMNPISISPATVHDRDDLFAWRNDPATQRNSKNADPVVWDTHVAWFADALMSADHKIYIGYRGNAKIGVVRFDKIDSASNIFLVSITISPAQRGRGLGKSLLSAGVETLPSAILMAEIASDNFASRRIFEACGFQSLTGDTSGGLLQYRRDPLVSNLGA